MLRNEVVFILSPEEIDNLLREIHPHRDFLSIQCPKLGHLVIRLALQTYPPHRREEITAVLEAEHIVLQAQEVPGGC